MSQPPGALVVGGDYRGLGIVRSLGRHGVRVWVAQDEHRVAGASRYAERAVRWPGTAEDALPYLLDLAATEGLEGWALLPTADNTAAFVARHHRELSAHYRLTTPTWENFRWAYDKRLAYRLADRVGVDHPQTFTPQSRDDLATLDCSFPVILKPAFLAELDPFTTAKAWAAADRESLLAQYDAASAYVEPGRILIQELIPGGGEHQFSYAALCIGGEARASLVARRARQWPTEFGKSSSFVETVELPELEGLARRLLSALHADGLVEVEFKRDPRDGRFKMLDINARAWGWHSIGRAAGVDFPYLQWLHLRGETIPELRGRPGVRWVRAVTDVPAAFAELRAGRLSPRQYARGIVGRTEFAMLAADDPMPGLLEIPLAIGMWWQRRGRTWSGEHQPALGS